MKRKLLLAAVLAAGALGIKAQTYTINDLESAGWTKATSLDDASSNYYVFVDAGAQATAMFRNNDSDARPTYNTIVDPLTDLQEVWVIEPNGDNFTIKGNEEAFFFNSGNAGWDDYVGHNNDNGNYTFTLNESKYSVKSVKTNLWVGPWNNDGSVSSTLPENVAANKEETQAPGFYLYAMSRSNFSAALATARLNTLGTVTKDSPTDVSAYIVNGNFTSKNAQGWTRTGTSGNQQWGQQTMEAWNNNNISVSQKIVGLPEGLYKVSADIIAGPNIVQTAYVFGNNGTAEKTILATENASAGNYGTMSNEVLGKTVTTDYINVSNGELTIGFKDPATGSGWVVVDNFKLTYYGFDLDELKSMYQASLTTAQAIDQESPMLATTLTALQNALSTYATCEETKDALTTASNALDAAAQAANASIEAYANANTALTGMKNILDATNFYTADALATYGYDENKAAYDNRTLTNEAASALVNPESITTWHAANAIDDLLMSVWDVDTEKWDSYHVNTWSTEGGSDGSNFNVPFIEYWTGDSDALGSKTLTATLSGLDNGLYSVSAWVRVKAKTGTAATDATGITMDVNGGGEGEYAAVDVTEGTQIGTSQFQIATYTAQNLVKDGKLILNFNVADDNNISWLSFKNVSYTKVRDLTEDEAFVAATEEDYAALNAAIASKTVGFEAGEYAPYNNIEAITALNTAKAIDQTANNEQSAIQAATAAITGATWTANAAEVNAIWDGSFEHEYSTTGNVQPIAWHGVGSLDNATNVRWMWNASSNAGLNATSSGKALFAKFTFKYGTENGYTLPLKSGYYKLTFLYGGWNEQGTREIKVYAGETNATISPATVTAFDNKAHTTASSWRTYSGIINVPTEGNYVLEFYRQSTTAQNQIVIGDIVLVRATAADFKEQLNAEIATANAIDKTTNVGDDAFQIPSSAATTLTNAISDAQGVYDDNEATIDGVLQAIDDLQAAETAYSNVELNAPAADKVYNIINVSDGYNHSGKAVTFKSASDADLASNTTSMGYNEEPGSIYPQGVTFTAVENVTNGYILSYTRADGKTVYVGTGASVGYINNGTNYQIRPTTDKTKAVTIQVKTTTTDGVWNLYNTLAKQNIGANGVNDQGFYTTASYSSMKLQEAVNNEVSLNIDAANQYGTLIIPFDADVPAGVTAYSVSEVDGSSLTLVEATEFAANTPYIVYAETGATATLEGLGAAYTDDSYTAGLLTGAYKEQTPEDDSYVLANIDNKVAFYIVDNDSKPTVGANHAYLTAPAADAGAGAKARAFFFDDDTATAIATISALTQGEVEAIYTLGGAKIQSLQKGINIVKLMNGEVKKVIVK